jgi:2-isopropylmalate synthase
VTFVTEDTTRSQPEHLRRMYQAAVRAGAGRVCIADTVGHATPIGTVAIVRFVRAILDEVGGASVGIDWHGHNDRGLAVANALAAAWAGSDRLHATALGVGERVGNPPMEQLVVNARLLGWVTRPIEHVAEYVAEASRMLGVAVPAWAPMVGRDAFRTSTGVHAAAILKAREKGDEDLADLVYSGVPAAWLGRLQEIEVGPMSGVSNVRCWLRAHGYAETPERVERLFVAGKESGRVLSDEELDALARQED